MSMFKEGEIVLVPTHDRGYVPRKVQSVYDDGCDIVCGYYATKYSMSNIHKCPRSIVKLLKDGK